MLNKGIDKGDAQVGEIDKYETLGTMLQEQMSMVHSQGQLQQKQAEEIRRVIQGCGDKLSVYIAVSRVWKTDWKWNVVKVLPKGINCRLIKKCVTRWTLNSRSIN